jgi:hypothetical protein
MAGIMESILSSNIAQWIGKIKLMSFRAKQKRCKNSIHNKDDLKQVLSFSFITGFKDTATDSTILAFLWHFWLF